MTDAECEQLLELLAKYVSEYQEGEDMSITDLAGDLAMSMDPTTDKANEYRFYIEANLG